MARRPCSIISTVVARDNYCSQLFQTHVLRPSRSAIPASHVPSKGSLAVQVTALSIRRVRSLAGTPTFFTSLCRYLAPLHTIRLPQCRRSPFPHLTMTGRRNMIIRRLNSTLTAMTESPIPASQVPARCPPAEADLCLRLPGATAAGRTLKRHFPEVTGVPSTC